MWVGEVTDSAFHPTTLTYWRRRLVSSRPESGLRGGQDRDRRDGGVVGQDAAGVGFHGARRCGGHQDAVTQLISAIRQVRARCRRLSGGLPAAVPMITTIRKPAIAWNDAEARSNVDALSPMPTGCWGICPSRNWAPKRLRRWRCWR